MILTMLVDLDRGQSLAMVLFNKDPVQLSGNDHHGGRVGSVALAMVVGFRQTGAQAQDSRC